MKVNKIHLKYPQTLIDTNGYSKDWNKMAQGQTLCWTTIENGIITTNELEKVTCKKCLNSRSLKENK